MPVEPLPCDNGGGGTPGPSCCAPSITSVALCQEDGTPLLLVLRSDCACDGAQPGAPEVAGWIDPATGAFTAGPAPAGAGPCPSSDCASVTVLRLCDQTPEDCVPFLRHLVHTCDGKVTASTDTATDGLTPYVPAGVPVDCESCTACEPMAMCPTLLGLSGPETWAMPEGTESLAVTVACGPVTITDCAGSSTVINECGTSFSWAAPAYTGCTPPGLCTPFTVDVPEGAAVYLNFLAPCGLDES